MEDRLGTWEFSFLILLPKLLGVVGEAAVRERVGKKDSTKEVNSTVQWGQNRFVF